VELKFAGEEVGRLRKDEVIPAYPDNPSLPLQVSKCLIEKIQISPFKA
jgi:hypothetical protein